MPRRALIPLSFVLVALVAFDHISPAALAQPSAQSPLQWTPCDDIPGEMECAGIQVPVDYARPNGATFTLRLGRLPATDPARKRGSLLIIPGGPGPGIKIMLVDNGPAMHLDEVRRFYDVVSFDPRGIERSNPVRCAPDLAPTVTSPVDRPPTPAEFEAIRRANEAFARSCIELSGDLIAHLSAKDTAGDIEGIRQAIGQTDGLVAYGGSYGSAYGAAYLESYGDHVKTIALDGVVDLGVDMPTFIMRNILSVEAEFGRFSRWCAREPACALHGQDVGDAYDAAAAVAPVARQLVSQFLSAGNDPDFGWSLIARMLADLRTGDTTILDALTSAGSLASTSNDPRVVAGKNGLFMGALCDNFGPQNDYAALLAVGAEVARLAPRFAWKFWDATPLAHGTASVGACIGWPVQPNNPPHRLRIGPQPDVMVANPTYDPATPLANALSVWLQIPEARLLIAEADGHQSWIVSRCAFDAQLRFLLDPASAPPVTTCPN